MRHSALYWWGGVAAALLALILTLAIAQSNTSARTASHYANEVSITIEGAQRVIRSNAIPNHPTGSFPGLGNPNAISPQTHEFRMPVNPQMASSVTPLGMHDFGVAINGVTFDPLAAEWYGNDPNSGWRYNPMHTLSLGIDWSNAHVQPTGAYHYHALPLGLLETLGNPKTQQLIGYAADGFPMYNNYDADGHEILASYTLKAGTRAGGPGGAHDGTFAEDYEYIPQSSELDECNGRYGTTAEYPNGTYYYVVTANYPQIPPCYKGVPDESFMRRGPGGGFGPPGGPGGFGPPPGGPGGFGLPPGGPGGFDPPPDLNALADILDVSVEQLRAALGPPPPDFAATARALGIDLQTFLDALEEAGPAQGPLGPPPPGGPPPGRRPPPPPPPSQP